MTATLPDKDKILSAIRETAEKLGRTPTSAQFMSHSGMSPYWIRKYFSGWREAVRAAGLESDSKNIPIEPEKLLADWGETVRRIRRIPTCDQYRREGTYSPGTFERRFGPWSAIPAKFREFTEGRPEWADVAALLPIENARSQMATSTRSAPNTSQHPVSIPADHKHTKLDDRATYGNPIDFRGLRHEPVNEQGVVFIFGMVARELGYHVEAVQAAYPDCEAKRQVDANKWQRVRIEFEFESRNFRDHGHPPDGCDIIVCWRHNWPDCPPNLEVLELSSVIRTLASSEE